ncbi:fimbria/pilus periplasmic chaperone [Salmonella enterica]
MVILPRFRLGSGQENTLRIIRTGGNQPEDRESFYWMNIESIP